MTGIRHTDYFTIKTFALPLRSLVLDAMRCIDIWYQEIPEVIRELIGKYYTGKAICIDDFADYDIRNKALDMLPLQLFILRISPDFNIRIELKLKIRVNGVVNDYSTKHLDDSCHTIFCREDNGGMIEVLAAMQATVTFENEDQDFDDTVFVELWDRGYMQFREQMPHKRKSRSCYIQLPLKNEDRILRPYSFANTKLTINVSMPIHQWSLDRTNIGTLQYFSSEEDLCLDIFKLFLDGNILYSWGDGYRFILVLRHNNLRNLSDILNCDIKDLNWPQKWISAKNAMTKILNFIQLKLKDIAI